MFPLKSKVLYHKRLENPWLTDQTLEKVRLKSEIFKLYKNNEISKQENNLFKNRLNKEIAREKKLYFNKLFSGARRNIKKSWDSLRSLLGVKRKPHLPDLLFPNLANDRCKKDILDKFNGFFASIGDELSSQLRDTTISRASHTNFFHNSFCLFPASQIEIFTAIQSLKVTKTNINEIPVNLLKKLANLLEIPMAIIINASFCSGVFPDALKIARITPIHKSGDLTDPSNFRPISSLPYISKVYEKLMTNRILSFCNKYSIVYRKQFGFQPGLSTSNALIELTEQIYESLNNKNHQFTILIDIKKAFDSVNQNILLEKLSSYGFRGVPLAWFESYLSDRQCYMEVDSVRSNTRIFNVGIPQGSILGPILFLLYVNCLPRISEIFNTLLYADDTTMSSSGHDVRQLTDLTNTELTKLVDWTLSNKLTLNAQKTELIIFSNRLSNDNHVSLNLQGSQLVPKNSVKYLGVHLDCKLNFRTHINDILSKISRHSGILYKIRDLLPLKTRLDYYHAFIYPYIEYNIIIWGGTFKSVLTPLNIQHKRVIRIICGAGYIEHTEPLFKKLNLLKLDDVYRFNLLTYMYRARARGEFGSGHNINTRNRGAPQSEFHRLSVCQHAISFAGPSAWNRLPNSLKAIESYPKFKKMVKNYLLEQYAS